MPKASRVGSDGSFLIGNRRHQIPETFSDRQVHSFRTLLEPIPDNPSGPSMTAELRRKQQDYLLRRSLAAVIPGLPLETVRKLPMTQVRSIHDWIARHRPELVAELDLQLE